MRLPRVTAKEIEKVGEKSDEKKTFLTIRSCWIFSWFVYCYLAAGWLR